MTQYRTVDDIFEILSDDRPRQKPRARASSPRKEGAIGAKNSLIVRNRKIMRRALDLVRRDPARKFLKDKLIEALGGRVAVTQELLAEVELALKSKTRAQPEKR